jgi:hypothetical protein
MLSRAQTQSLVTLPLLARVRREDNELIRGWESPSEPVNKLSSLVNKRIEIQVTNNTISFV